MVGVLDARPSGSEQIRPIFFSAIFLAQGSLDECGDHLRDELEEHQGLDTAVLLQPDRRDIERGFQKRMSLFDPGLVLVDLEHVNGRLLGVRCQREDPIHSHRLCNVFRVCGHMQPRHVLNSPAEGSLCRRFAAGDGLELLDGIPFDFNPDPLLGMMLSNDLIAALSNRSVRLRSPHAPEIKALQPLYGALR